MMRTANTAIPLKRVGQVSMNTPTAGLIVYRDDGR
jgi:hypothetical protein